MAVSGIEARAAAASESEEKANLLRSLAECGDFQEHPSGIPSMGRPKWRTTIERSGCAG